jgi:hypothetical protein
MWQASMGTDVHRAWGAVPQPRMAQHVAPVGPPPAPPAPVLLPPPPPAPPVHYHTHYYGPGDSGPGGNGDLAPAAAPVAAPAAPVAAPAAAPVAAPAAPAPATTPSWWWWVAALVVAFVFFTLLVVLLFMVGRTNELLASALVSTGTPLRGAPGPARMGGRAWGRHPGPLPPGYPYSLL